MRAARRGAARERERAIVSDREQLVLGAAGWWRWDACHFPWESFDTAHGVWRSVLGKLVQLWENWV